MCLFTSTHFCSSDGGVPCVYILRASYCTPFGDCYSIKCSCISISLATFPAIVAFLPQYTECVHVRNINTCMFMYICMHSAYVYIGNVFTGNLLERHRVKNNVPIHYMSIHVRVFITCLIFPP